MQFLAVISNELWPRITNEKRVHCHSCDPPYSMTFQINGSKQKVYWYDMGCYLCVQKLTWVSLIYQTENAEKWTLWTSHGHATATVNRCGGKFIIYKLLISNFPRIPCTKLLKLVAFWLSFKKLISSKTINGSSTLVPVPVGSTEQHRLLSKICT